jgi:hypothetical protein
MLSSAPYPVTSSDVGQRCSVDFHLDRILKRFFGYRFERMASRHPLISAFSLHGKPSESNFLALSRLVRASATGLFDPTPPVLRESDS